MDDKNATSVVLGLASTLSCSDVNDMTVLEINPGSPVRLQDFRPEREQLFSSIEDWSPTRFKNSFRVSKGKPLARF